MDGGNVEDSSPTEEKSFTEVFEENCPIYISYGMTYREFWYGKPEMTRAYWDAHILKNKARNQELWLQGKYLVESIASALDPKHNKYPKDPWDIYPKTEAEKKAEAEAQRRKIIEYFTQIKQRWKNGTD